MKKLILLLIVICTVNIANAQNYNLLIGTYTNKGNSEGIYVYDFNSTTGETKLKNSVKTINPSFLTVSKNKKFVFSVNEDGKNSAISSFNFNSASGQLNFKDKKTLEASDPCYIMTYGNKVLTANYSGGSVGVFTVAKNGTFLEKEQIIKHTGKSIDPKRQLSSHVHQIQLTPDKKYIVTDLGEDKIYVYASRISEPKDLLLKNTINTNPGSGPRHLAFSPNCKFAYLAHEFNGSITAYNYRYGGLTKLQEIGTVIKGYKGKIDGADIHVSPDGKFLYETNRGDLNTISLFAIARDGKLTFVETVSTLGKGPRNFAIDPSGKFLLVAHQYTNDVVIFNRDQITGKLTASGKKINVGVPVCLVFSK